MDAQQERAGFVFDEVDERHRQGVGDPDHGDCQRQVEPEQRLQENDGHHLRRHGDEGDEQTDENAFCNRMSIDAQKRARDFVFCDDMVVFFMQAGALEKSSDHRSYPAVVSQYYSRINQTGL